MQGRRSQPSPGRCSKQECASFLSSVEKVSPKGVAAIDRGNPCNLAERADVILAGMRPRLRARNIRGVYPCAVVFLSGQSDRRNRSRPELLARIDAVK